MNRDFLIREGDGVRPAGTLVLGRGLLLSRTAGGQTELSGTDDVVLRPSGGDDAAALQQALDTGRRVRLAAGTFRLAATVTVPRGRWLTGGGPGRTVLQATHPGTVVAVGGGTAAPATAVEGVTIVGVTPSSAGQTGIEVGAGPWEGLTFRDLEVKGCGRYGVYVQQATQVLVSNLSVQGAGQTGLYLNQVTQAACDAVRVSGSNHRGVFVLGGSGQRISALRVEGCARGIEIETASGVVLDGAELTGNVSAVVLDFSRDVVLNACRAINASDPALVIYSGGNHVVNGFVSDRSTAAPASPDAHVWVASPSGPATGITLIGCRKVNAAGALPTYEVDVSAAGGRVVFIQHDFDPARINSGGWFASL